MAMAKNGRQNAVRALLDQGSQGSFVNEEVVQYLGLKKSLVTNQVTGLGDNKKLVSKAMVTIDIKSRIDSNVKFSVKAHVLSSITSLLPSRPVDIIDCGEITGALADPQYNVPNKIDILLGANVYSQVLREGVKRGTSGTPIAQATSLGWILSGVANSTATASANIKVMHCNIYDGDEEVPEEEKNNQKAVNLPHHIVVQQDKAATKVRVVSDASCNRKNKQSLKNQMLVGLTLQPERRHCVTNRRAAPISMAADVKKKNHHVKIDRQDTEHQRTLWTDANASGPNHSRLTHVTVGTTSAPYLASKSPRQVAQDHHVEYPAASETVQKQLKLDDVMMGEQAMEEGTKLSKEINETITKRNFSPETWTSNGKKLMQERKESEEMWGEISGKEVVDYSKLKTDEVIKNGELTWHRLEDSFRYHVDQLDGQEHATKGKSLFKHRYESHLRPIWKNLPVRLDGLRNGSCLAERSSKSLEGLRSKPWVKNRYQL